MGSYKKINEHGERRSFVYSIAIWFLRAILNTFFRSVYVVGEEKFPTTGPTIVVANHSNQFVDGMMLQVQCQRPISFLIAEKSMHRPVIGDLARIMGAVPVVRRKDIAVKGKGTISEVKTKSIPNEKQQGTTTDYILIVGKDTEFQKQFQPGYQIEIEKTILSVKQILSDTELLIDEKSIDDQLRHTITSSSSGVKFRSLPKVDHSTMFSAVYKTLESGGCIGIFPEGTSTDHTKMLEFQAGVAIMAFGAKAKGIDVKIQPVGLNYFKGHRWRSRVVMRYASPLTIPEDIFELHKTNKKEASNKLLCLIRESLESVTFQAPSYGVARVAHVCRDLYADSKQLTIEESVELSRRFAYAYEKLSEKPEVAAGYEAVKNYSKKLDALGINDKDVRALVDYGRLKTIGHLLLHLLFIIFAFPLSVIGMVWVGPIVFIATMKSKQEMVTAKAGAPSTKVKGLDVVASKKVVIGSILIPIFYLLYLAIGTLINELLLQNNDSITASIFHWVTPILIAIGIPIYLQVGLLAGDKVRESVRAVRRLFISLWNSHVATELQKERQVLHDQIVAIVDKYISELDFPDRVLTFENEESYVETFTEAM